MNYKIGGGKHLQMYDETNGQYTDEEKASLIKEDRKNLALVYCFSLDSDDLIFHWPSKKIHDRDYYEIFTHFARDKIAEIQYNPTKSTYLLNHIIDRDKSSFLIKLGYAASDPDELQLDVIKGTDISSLEYSSNNTCYKCIAKTVLKGKLVTSVWALEVGFKLRFITLIPGGDKVWK